eukprot:295711_1
MSHLTMANRVFSVGYSTDDGLMQSKKLQECYWAEERHITDVYCCSRYIAFRDRTDETGTYYLSGHANGLQSKNKEIKCIDFFKQNNLRIEKIFTSSGAETMFILASNKQIYVYGGWRNTNAIDEQTNNSRNPYEHNPLGVGFGSLNGMIKHIANGYDYAIALANDNSVLSTEEAQFGGNGLPYSEISGFGYKLPFTHGRWTKIHPTFKVISISVGRRHTLFLTNDGNVFSLGGNDTAQLGQGNADTGTILRHDKPKQIDFFKDKHVTQVFCGSMFSIALDDKGRVFSWGNNQRGECGVGVNSKLILTPTLIRSPRIKDVKCGTMHSCIISLKNDFYFFGDNMYNECIVENANPVLSPVCVNKIVKEQTGLNIRNAAVGHYRTVLVLNSDEKKEECMSCKEHLKTNNSLNGKLNGLNRTIVSLQSKLEQSNSENNRLKDEQKK